MNEWHNVRASGRKEGLFRMEAGLESFSQRSVIVLLRTAQFGTVVLAFLYLTAVPARRSSRAEAIANGVS